MLSKSWIGVPLYSVNLNCIVRIIGGSMDQIGANRPLNASIRKSVRLYPIDTG